MWSKIISLALGIILGLGIVFGYQRYLDGKEVIDGGIDFSQIEGPGIGNDAFSGALMGTGAFTGTGLDSRGSEMPFSGGVNE